MRLIRGLSLAHRAALDTDFTVGPMSIITPKSPRLRRQTRRWGGALASERGQITRAYARGSKCPGCGGPMKARNGRHGWFLSCAHYPTCQGSRSVDVRKTPKADTYPYPDGPEPTSLIEGRSTILDLHADCSLCGRAIPRGPAFAAGRTYQHVRCHHVALAAERAGAKVTLKQ